MSVKVIAELNPVSIKRVTLHTDPKPVADIVRELDSGFPVSQARVSRNGEIVTDLSTPALDGDTLWIKFVPRGNSEQIGTGMKVGGWALMVIGVIVAAATSWTGIGAFIGSAMIGAGLSLTTGGTVLLNTNFNIPSLKDQEKPENDPSVRGGKNQARPHGRVPVLFGRRRIYPDLAANSYTEITGNSQYLTQLFCGGYKDCVIDTASFKFGETPILDFSQTKNINHILAGADPLIRMEILQAGQASAVYPFCVHEDAINGILKHQSVDGLGSTVSGAVIRSTPPKTDAITVDIFLHNGIGKYNDDGGLTSASVEVRALYKLSSDPDSAYQLMGFFNGSNNTLSGAELKTKRYQITKSGLVPGQYTVKVERVTPDSTNSKIIDHVYTGSIRSIKSVRPIRAERQQDLTVIALRVMATPQLNGVIESFNYIATAKLPVYSGGGSGKNYWLTSAETRNPASALLYALQGRAAQQSVEHEDIDWPALEDFYTWCAEHGYYCDDYLSQAVTIAELLRMIGGTARADVLRIDSKISVVQDIERAAPVQLFTPKNTKSYSVTMLSADAPDAIALRFIDEAAGYAQNELLVYNTPDGNRASEPETVQKVDLWGVTTSTQARRVGMYNYGCVKNRPFVHTIEVDFEYLLCTKGDWVQYAGDIALAGITQGRIVQPVVSEGLCAGIRVDEPVEMSADTQYAVRIRRADGSIVLKDVLFMPPSPAEWPRLPGGAGRLIDPMPGYPALVDTTVTKPRTELFFTTPCDESSMPRPGDMYAFGVRGAEVIDLIITGIQPGQDLSATLTCVEYSPEIFRVDDPDFTLPEFENKISETPGAIDHGAITPDNWREYRTYHDDADEPPPPAGTGETNGWHHVQTAASQWVSAKTAPSIDAGAWGAPVRLTGKDGRPGKDGIGIDALPRDPYAYWSCDDLPDIPDNPAGTLHRNDPAWTGWSVSTNYPEGTLSVANGVIAVSGRKYISNTISIEPNKIILIRARQTEGALGQLKSDIQKDFTGWMSVIYGNLTRDWQVFSAVMPDEPTHLVNIHRSNYSDEQGVVEIADLYIGDGSRSTPLIDNSGNDRHFPLAGAVASPGKLNGGLRFLGTQASFSNQHVNFPGDFTIAFWMNNTQNAKQTILSNDAFQIGINTGGSLEASAFLPDGTPLTITEALPGNEWRHVILKRQGAYVKVKIDNAEKNQFVVSTLRAGGKLRLGADFVQSNTTIQEWQAAQANLNTPLKKLLPAIGTFLGIDQSGEVVASDEGTNFYYYGIHEAVDIFMTPAFLSALFPDGNLRVYLPASSAIMSENTLVRDALAEFDSFVLNSAVGFGAELYIAAQIDGQPTIIIVSSDGSINYRAIPRNYTRLATDYGVIVGLTEAGEVYEVQYGGYYGYQTGVPFSATSLTYSGSRFVAADDTGRAAISYNGYGWEELEPVPEAVTVGVDYDDELVLFSAANNWRWQEQHIAEAYYTNQYTGLLDEIVVFDRATTDDEDYVLYRGLIEKQFTGHNTQPVEKYLGAIIAPDLTGSGIVTIAGGSTVKAGAGNFVSYTGETQGVWEQWAVYQWKGAGWVKLDAAKNADCYMRALPDIVNGAPSGAFGNLFVRMLFAQQAAIDELQTKIIILQGGGRLQSQNFREETPSLPGFGMRMPSDGQMEMYNCKKFTLLGAEGLAAIAAGRELSKGAKRAYIDDDEFTLQVYDGGNMWRTLVAMSFVAGLGLVSCQGFTESDPIQVSNSTFGTLPINAIAYGDSKFVAGGGSGKMAYSADGISWTAVSNSTFETSLMYAIAYGNGKFVAVGNIGKMAYSADGISWTAVSNSTFGGSLINAIAYGNGKFVAGSENGKIAYSIDGISWTAVSNSTFGGSLIYAIAYGNGKFVAVGNAGNMAYSADGISWTAVSNSTFETSIIQMIAYGNGKFVAVGNAGKMAYSADGISWTAVSNSTFGTSIIFAIAYGDSKFVAGGDAGKMAHFESDFLALWQSRGGFVEKRITSATTKYKLWDGKWLNFNSNGTVNWSS